MLVVHCKRRRAIAVAFILGLLLVGLLVKALWPTYIISQVSAQKRLVPIYKVATEEQAISISFDASWGAEYTLNILDTLDEYGVKATFFLVNIWLEDYPEMAQEIAARGHEIGLHSTTHPHFPTLSEEQMREELCDNAKMIQEITGRACTLFRPPFGDYNNCLIQTAEELGYTVIQWSIDSLDWKDLCAADICTRVLKKIEPGDIVLFHNNGRHTAEALPQILTTLQENGLAVIPIGELLLAGDCYTDYNGVQRRK